jgi:hypothetical protein
MFKKVAVRCPAKPIFAGTHRRMRTLKEVDRQMKTGETYESVASGQAVEIGSERGFGLVFAVVFGLIGIWPAIILGWTPQINPTALRW